MSLRVLHAGLYSLLVDFGRPGSRSLGVPVGGAADRSALVLGNALVGNPLDAVALEVCLAGPALRADADCACVVYGAPFELESDRQKLTAGTTFSLRAEETLQIRGTSSGMRAYLCVRGGFAAPVVLGSRSGLEPVAEGDVLPCPLGIIASRFIRPEFTWNREPNMLRVLPGPQADWFDEKELLGRPFTVTPAGNRMGLRLSGEPLDVPPRELVSEPVCPGAVQVTRDGQCIVLGVDGQTIGGYPKIAQVISADLDKLAQLRPGETVRFRRVGLAGAEALYREKQADLKEWLARLRALIQ